MSTKDSERTLDSMREIDDRLDVEHTSVSRKHDAALAQDITDRHMKNLSGRKNTYANIAATVLAAVEEALSA